MTRIFSLILLFLAVQLDAQVNYAVNNIPLELLDNANAVIRLQSINIMLFDVNSMTIKSKEVITVLNRKGLQAVTPGVAYDAVSSIKGIEAVVYDKNGKEIKKYKKRDFSDLSATGSNLYSDNRILVIEHTPADFPFTFEFTYEKKTSSTAFFPQWDPSPIYQVSTVYSVFSLENPKQIPLTSRKFNLEKFGAKVEETSSRYHYEIRNLNAIDREYLSPHYTEFTPVAKIAPSRFELEGKSGEIKDWRDFGIWQKTRLLAGRDKLPEKTILQISKLVEHVDDPKEKARIIYNYMQEKTRYISVQVGIGGWQPSTAMEVDKLGYGDCKGLTNYTQALLKSQGIESIYTIVNAGESGRDIDEDFVALQGNHVILTVPFEDETVFLECTNQQIPFNYIGTHTDDRKVLLITDEGGVMAKTHIYKASDNFLDLSASLLMTESLKIAGDLEIESTGLTYGTRYNIEQQTSDDIQMIYKELWGHLNDLKLTELRFVNDKKDIRFTETLHMETDNYISKAGNRVLLNPNLFKRIEDVPSIKKERTQPFEIRRGLTENDSISLDLPLNFRVESIFDPIEINTEFGQYNAKAVLNSDNRLIYVRKLTLNSGRFPKEKYQDYVKFIKLLVKKDRSKIVLIPR